MIRTGGLTTLLALLTATSVTAQTPPAPRPDDEQVVREWLRHELKSTDVSPPHYTIGWSDLNDDGRLEAFVYVSGPDWCGTGGCDLYVLELTRTGVRKLADTGLARPPVAVLETRTHGRRDIAVLVCGGGIMRCYSARLRFDGRQYIRNPTDAPVVKGHPPQQVVIGDDAVRSN
ncbi:hypothetical protein [Phenylobacterium sp.]|uniref:hypothetical protein n=1 Tax=Phenylobacterium sp. TaxID=1871053 RepID=UPI001203EB6F|nr:hypothetical protein [Phenylobacterium sp.]THD58977.1 MAG: hypothetical protein E8A12_12010 [Phenylobacterium sp.]